MSNKNLPIYEYEWLKIWPEFRIHNQQALKQRFQEALRAPIERIDFVQISPILSKNKLGRKLLEKHLILLEKEIENLVEIKSKDYSNAYIYEYFLDLIRKKYTKIRFFLDLKNKSQSVRSWEEKRLFAKKVSIKDLYEKHGCGKLKGSGDKLSGICPFHKDKNASFSIVVSLNYYNCFAGCSSGDSIEFIKKLFNVDFREAVDILTK